MCLAWLDIDGFAEVQKLDGRLLGLARNIWDMAIDLHDVFTRDIARIGAGEAEGIFLIWIAWIKGNGLAVLVIDSIEFPFEGGIA